MQFSITGNGRYKNIDGIDPEIFLSRLNWAYELQPPPHYKEACLFRYCSISFPDV